MKRLFEVMTAWLNQVNQRLEITSKELEQEKIKAYKHLMDTEKRIADEQGITPEELNKRIKERIKEICNRK